MAATNPNNVYGLLASNDQIELTAKALEANGIHTIVAENGAEASKKLFELLPANAEVFAARSMTLTALGIADEIDTSGRYNSVRVQLAKLDRRTQGLEMQKIGAAPEYMVGSVHAVTETGSVIIASMTGSQLSGYVGGAAHVIWVVGAQKIVPTLAEGMKRIEEYTLPLEDERIFKAFGVHSHINKLLIIHKEAVPGRITMILVKENLGF